MRSSDQRPCQRFGEYNVGEYGELSVASLVAQVQGETTAADLGGSARDTKVYATN